MTLIITIMTISIPFIIITIIIIIIIIIMMLLLFAVQQYEFLMHYIILKLWELHSFGYMYEG